MAKEQSKQVSPVEQVRHSLGLMAGQFNAVFPTQAHVDRFIRVVMTSVQSNVALAEEADRASLYAAAMKCAQDGLLPDGKEAVLKIYNTNVGTAQKKEWKKIVQYEPMIGGLLKKLRNSGEILGAPNVQIICANDEFTYELGDRPQIIHRPLLGDRGPVIGAYSIVELKDGGVSREVMDVAEIETIRASSKSGASGPWVTNYGEMCRKVVFKRHYKKLPSSSDLDNVINYDNELEHGELREVQQPNVVRLNAPEARPKGLEALVDKTPGVEKDVKVVSKETFLTPGAEGQSQKSNKNIVGESENPDPGTGPEDLV